MKNRQRQLNKKPDLKLEEKERADTKNAGDCMCVHALMPVHFTEISFTHEDRVSARKGHFMAAA